MSDSDTAKRDLFKRMRLVVGLLGVVGVFYVFMGSATQGGQWFMEVDEAVAATNISPDRPIRVKGDVVVGSYVHVDGTTEHRFSIGGKDSMQVYYNGPMPDVFAEGREVVVEGLKRSDGVLEATEVIAKCPSKYEGGSMTPEAREHLEATGAPGAKPADKPSGGGY